MIALNLFTDWQMLDLKTICVDFLLIFNNFKPIHDILFVSFAFCSRLKNKEHINDSILSKLLLILKIIEVNLDQIF